MEETAKNISQNRSVDRFEATRETSSFEEGTAFSLPEPSSDAALTKEANVTQKLVAGLFDEKAADCVHG